MHHIVLETDWVYQTVLNNELAKSPNIDGSVKGPEDEVRALFSTKCFHVFKELHIALCNCSLDAVV